MDTVKLIVIILVCLLAFTGGMLFLLWFFRARFVPKIPESREPDPDSEDAPGFVPYEPAAAQKSYAAANAQPAYVPYTPNAAKPSYTPYQPKAGDYDDYDDDDDFDDYPEDDGNFAGYNAPASEAEDFGSQSAHLSDLLDCVYLPGRRLSECGISGDFISEDGSEVPVDGDLFGEYAYGGLTLLPGGAGDPTVESFYIIGTGLSFSDCRAGLTERFGEPETEGEQEGEDGSTTSYVGFATGFGTLWLSKGSENDYLNINFT